MLGQFWAYVGEDNYRLITVYKLFWPPTIIHIMILMLISLYILENYAIIFIEMMT